VERALIEAFYDHLTMPEYMWGYKIKLGTLNN